ncbi:MAG: efflux RND transporter periplasmic adaptor subunit [Muricauda sp.]|nr:efflux RND transporter periplasmic adaptor subunit [Allomuricauda sp.]
MKKENIVYIGIAVIAGLLVGYFIFGGKVETASMDAHNHDAEMAAGEMWTCSMHPQIMQPEPGSCPICGMDLIPADANGEGLAANQIKMTENAMVLAGVETLVVGSDIEGSDHIKLSGKVAINQESDAVQSAYFDGRIESLSINFEGEEISKGQKLATIYAPALVAAQQELLTAAGLKSSQPQLYNAVRSKLKLWKLSDAQIDQIESSGKVVENFPVYANVSGVVSAIMVEEGDYIKTGSPLVKVANLNSVWVVFDAYENQLSQFKTGQGIEVSTKSYPNENFKAKVSFVDPILNAQTRTLEVRAELDNKNGLLKPGMFVQGEVEVSKMEDNEVLTVPESAVLWTGKRSVVYVQPDISASIFEMREVELGNLMNGAYVVNSGLKSGERVVAKGTFTVDAAAQLQGKKSMMNQDGGKTMTGHEGHMGMSSAMNMEFSEKAQNMFEQLLRSYMKLKDGLVASDATQVQHLAKEGVEVAKQMGTTNMNDMAKQHLAIIIEKLTSISKASSLEKQRDDFIMLSENMIMMGNQMKGLNEKVFVQHCPMADNNNGANWLSLDEEIRNPYYGDAMLTCGSVVQVIE